ncbi:GPW/gp25 family protein [Parashewanella spongiae]|nr:GPW/gp25 family protein [Parashewanella spongiae]MCL1076796.1 GPW/gp25 family protein [Parashewanella spongiae]
MMNLTEAIVNDGYSDHDAVIKHICNLISSRAPLWVNAQPNEYTSGTIVDLGMNYFTHNHSKFRVDELKARILKLIKDFEPRLTQVAIEIDEKRFGTNVIKFELSALLNTDKENEVLSLESFLDFSSNNFTVNSGVNIV